ncbi:hypothetical protein PRIPAC_93277 [Pristionchus pacificus]|uniref:Uncharacterized protein n=1 Tax=Pristionchus pacificus TaxID=54126 RepID=A0A2A6BPU3_PRIPA|nr:hypothetical protein PRIPAC_93277 [Pristionchus pacificus]|eukprot:PDM67793.1 hypothetical protein PRIPAC_45837 [Pristionchus pacificus]
MGASTSSLPAGELDRISIESGLTKKSVLTLYKRFLQLASHREKDSGQYFLTKSDFIAIEELKLNPLGERIVDAFFADAERVLFYLFN